MIMKSSADIVIIGAGIIGMCTAMQISKRSSASIIVLDKGRGPGEGSTGASSAICRHKYTHQQMIQLAKDGISTYRAWSEFLDNPKPLAEFQKMGVLWLSDGATDWPSLESNRLNDMGIRASVLSDQDLKDHYPALSPCIVSPNLKTGEAHSCVAGGSHLLEVDGGYMDPADTLQDLITASRDRGVEVRFRTGVNSVLVEGDKVSGIELNSGTQIHSRSVVNATGPWCNHFFEELGLENPWPLVATRVQILHLDRPEEIIGTLPVCVDLLGGIYFRTQNQGQQIILGSILEEDEQEVVTQPEEFDRMVDDIFTQTKLHALHHRLPSLPYRGKVGGYSGLYTTNLTDVHPIVGQTPIDGFFVANGFSGHGFKLGPAIGSLLAQAITGQQSTDFDTSVDSEFLAFDRLPIQVDSKSVLA